MLLWAVLGFMALMAAMVFLYCRRAEANRVAIQQMALSCEWRLFTKIEGFDAWVVARNFCYDPWQGHMMPYDVELYVDSPNIPYPMSDSERTYYALVAGRSYTLRMQQKAEQERLNGSQ